MNNNESLKEKIAQDIKQGWKLREARRAKGIQAKFVAAALEVTPGHLSDMEHGRRHWHPHHIKAYLKAIGV